MLLSPRSFPISERLLGQTRALHIFCNPKRSSKDKGQGFLLGNPLKPPAFPLRLCKTLPVLPWHFLCLWLWLGPETPVWGRQLVCTFPLRVRNPIRHREVLKRLPHALLSNDSSEKGHFLFHTFGRWQSCCSGHSFPQAYGDTCAFVPWYFEIFIYLVFLQLLDIDEVYMSFAVL